MEKLNKTVLLSAPSHDGKVNVWHATALAETCKVGLSKGINVIPIYMSYDSLVQRARNDIVALALEHKIDDLVFIDCDQDWKSQDFFRLLEHNVDVVGAPVIKKSDDEQYNIKILNTLTENELGLIEVTSVGTGFMRISRNALEKVWAISEPYKEFHKKQESRMVFDVKVIDGSLYSEDVIFCKKWKELGGKIYIDPSINCGHSGEKRWVGNFLKYSKNYLKSNRSANGN